MTINLSDIEKACEAATPDWQDLAGIVRQRDNTAIFWCPQCDQSAEAAEEADAEFIVTSRTALPALAKALRAVLGRHTNDNGRCRACWDGYLDLPQPWPCAEVRAITDTGITLGGSDE